MASHHQHLRHQNCHTNTTTSASCCCCTNIASPQPPPVDPLLQVLAAHLLQPLAPHSQSQYPSQIFSHYIKPQAELHPHNQYQYQYQRQRKQRFQPLDHYDQIHSVLSSLLCRIDALESSLRRFSPLISQPPCSLRDVAARTIQTHFRAFLVRRSRTLAQLKDLAFIKSSLNALKSSVSGQTRLDYYATSHKAMDLLLKLDSIEGGDPIIRDGKRSISRELVRFLESFDGVCIKRHELSSRAMKNTRVAQNGRKYRVPVENLRNQGREIRGFSRFCENDEGVELEGFHHGSENEEQASVFVNGKHDFGQARNEVLVRRQGLQSKVKKSVRFADNGDVSRVVWTRTHDPNSCDDAASIDDQRELVETLCREVEETGELSKVTEDVDEEALTESGGSSQSSDSEGNPKRNLRTKANCEIRGHYQNQNGYFVLSAPLPVKMESRADLMKNRKTEE